MSTQFRVLLRNVARPLINSSVATSKFSQIRVDKACHLESISCEKMRHFMNSTQSLP